MAQWELRLKLDRRAGLPLFQQIGEAIEDAIRRGRLRPGDRLPGARVLARSLGVNRLTVVAAIDELAAEGWILTRRARGAFVAADIPDPRPQPLGGAQRRHNGVPNRVRFDLEPAPSLELPFHPPPANTLFFAQIDTRLVPHDLIGRAYRRAVRHEGGTLLRYDRPHGQARLRRAMATMLSATRGSPQTRTMSVSRAEARWPSRCWRAPSSGRETWDWPRTAGGTRPRAASSR